jgi:hypothetical protein
MCKLLRALFIKVKVITALITKAKVIKGLKFDFFFKIFFFYKFSNLTNNKFVTYLNILKYYFKERMNHLCQ